MGAMRSVTLLLGAVLAAYALVLLTVFRAPLVEQSLFTYDWPRASLRDTRDGPSLQQHLTPQQHGDATSTIVNRKAYAPPPQNASHYAELQAQAAAILREGRQGPLAWNSITDAAYKPCANIADGPYVDDRNVSGYLVIQASGGLNQMRLGICDSVAVARILGAKLVLPILDDQSWWTDKSTFGDIFNVTHFVYALARDVVVVPKLPPQFEDDLHTKVIPRYSTAGYYRENVLPLLRRFGALKLVKFDYRLANEGLPLEIQRLRCRANYHALKFTDKIIALGDLAIQRLSRSAPISSAQDPALAEGYVALHLRFEPDMLAFSGCDYGGGEAEKREFDIVRLRWPTLRLRSPELERRKGKCPLTPQEIGLLLAAIGVSRETRIFVASGEIYGGEASFAPLRELYPNLETKESVLTSSELRPLKDFSSQRAAVDYHVCLHSGIFIANNQGNMAVMLAGQRRYLYHRKTLMPHAIPLAKLFLASRVLRQGTGEKRVLGWDDFTYKVRSVQRGFMGEPQEPRRGPMGEIVHGELGFHYEPWECLCKT